MEREYNAITISGKVADGTSTLSRQLEEKLGWKRVSVNELQRAYDAQMSHDSNTCGASSRSDDHEKEIDGLIKQALAQEKNIIVEGWLAGFFAKDMLTVLKVLLVCPIDVRVKRVMARDNMTQEEATSAIQKREEENITKWHSLYGVHDFWAPDLYDLVIDTDENGVKETGEKVIEMLNF